jgi:hypothetical protein
MARRDRLTSRGLSGTKDLKTANRVAKPVLTGFDEVLQKAEGLLRASDAPPAPRTALTEAEIKMTARALAGAQGGSS